jgi:hypothetical protein
MFGLPTRAERRCPGDGAERELIQPDERRPHRLLMVCPICGSWAVLEGARRADRPADGWEERGRHFGPAAALAAVG